MQLMLGDANTAIDTTDPCTLNPSDPICQAFNQPATSMAPSSPDKLLKIAWGVLAVTSAIVSGYHGVKRHHGSVGWGIVWFGLGGLFPVITPTIAFAQGYGKAK